MSTPSVKAGDPYLLQWERIQRSVASVTGLSFTTMNRGGKILAEAGDISLCKLLGGDREKGPCSDSCSAAAGRAYRENATRHFRCRAGLECFASPIRVDGRPVGTVLGGRILEKAPDLAFFEELARSSGHPEEEVLRAVGGLRIGSARSLTRVAEMVEQTSEAVFSGAFRMHKAQKRLSLLNSLFRLGTDLTPEKDPHEVYALIVNTVSILFDVDGACLYLESPESGAFRLKTVFGSAGTYGLPLEMAKGFPFLAELLERREPVVTKDYHRLLRSGLPEKVRTAATFPLLFGEDVRGMLLIINPPLEAGDTDLIFAFCNQAATAIQNTLLRKKLREKTEETGRLVAIHKRLGSILDRDLLLEALFEETAKMTGAEQASLMVRNSRTNELMVRMARGEHSAVIRKVALGPGEGIAGKVAQRGLPLVVPDLANDERFRRRRRPRYRTNSFLIVPVISGGSVSAVINLADKADGSFTQTDLEAVMAVLGHATIALQRSELYARTKALQKISTTDPLTQLVNRRYFQRRSQEEILRSQRYNLPLSLVMLDVDDFKGYNDRLGHLAGDDILVGVSRTLKETVRSIDVVSRFGGEEFAILSPQTAAEEALRVAERVREAVSSRSLSPVGSDGAVSISLSAGVATYPEQAGSLQELLDNADRALYRAKRSGKNRVLLFNTP
jgi:diguanylate cyclase (GGDEF)-like protein